jgi:hypothetical protein
MHPGPLTRTAAELGALHARGDFDVVQLSSLHWGSAITPA